MLLSHVDFEARRKRTDSQADSSSAPKIAVERAWCVWSRIAKAGEVPVQIAEPVSQVVHGRTGRISGPSAEIDLGELN